jgi:hypothetical protein
VQEQQNSSRGWDGSTLSKEEMGAMARNREEAAIKRVRALQYASIQNVVYASAVSLSNISFYYIYRKDARTNAPYVVTRVTNNQTNLLVCHGRRRSGSGGSPCHGTRWRR